MCWGGGGGREGCETAQGSRPQCVEPKTVQRLCWWGAGG